MAAFSAWPAISALLTATDRSAAQSSSDEELSLAAICQENLGAAANCIPAFLIADSLELGDSQALLRCCTMGPHRNTTELLLGLMLEASPPDSGQWGFLARRR